MTLKCIKHKKTTICCHQKGPPFDIKHQLISGLPCLKAVAKLAVDKFAVIKFAVDKLAVDKLAVAKFAVDKFAVGQKSC